MQIELSPADYSNSRHRQDLIQLLDHYAQDPMGGATGLSDFAKENLPGLLAAYPTAFSVLAWVDGQAAGLVNCFETLSTFKCKPLVNIHDVVVHKSYRGLGLSTRMLNMVEAIALERGCCKLTLEVLQGNTVAREAYRKFGFSGYQLDPKLGQAMFWEKELPEPGVQQ